MQNAVADTAKIVTRNEVKDGVFEVHEFVEYLRQLADADPSMELTAGKVWTLYSKVVREGMYFAEVTDDLGLIEPDWSNTYT
jgi:hypothetical protein